MKNKNSTATETIYGLQYRAVEITLQKHIYNFTQWEIDVPEVILWFSYAKVINNRLFDWVRLDDKENYIIELTAQGIVNLISVQGWIATDGISIFTQDADDNLLRLNLDFDIEYKYPDLKVGKVLSFRNHIVFNNKLKDNQVCQLIDNKVIEIPNYRLICDWSTEAFRCFISKDGERRKLTWSLLNSNLTRFDEKDHPPLCNERQMFIGETLFPTLRLKRYIVREVEFE